MGGGIGLRQQEYPEEEIPSGILRVQVWAWDAYVGFTSGEEICQLWQIIKETSRTLPGSFN